MTKPAAGQEVSPPANTSNGNESSSSHYELRKSESTSNASATGHPTEGGRLSRLFSIRKSIIHGEVQRSFGHSAISQIPFFHFKKNNKYYLREKESPLLFVVCLWQIDILTDPCNINLSEILYASFVKF